MSRFDDIFDDVAVGEKSDCLQRLSSTMGRRLDRPSSPSVRLAYSSSLRLNAELTTDRRRSGRNDGRRLLQLVGTVPFGTLEDRNYDVEKIDNSGDGRVSPDQEVAPLPHQASGNAPSTS